jgi:hypothetical protein
MRVLAVTAGVVLILIVLWDAFEVIILPRRVTRRFRLASLFYRTVWIPYSAIALRMRGAKRREKILSFFGPLSLILLLCVWVLGAVIGFALIHWVAGSDLSRPLDPRGLGSYLYLSGSTFTTIGLGDLTPHTPLAKALVVLEAGIGLGFLALVISYLPVLYQAFSRREVNISLLDARAGTPPTAAELVRRHSEGRNMEALHDLLRDWELWAADLMESHLSYPVLCYFRSQHDNQSWVSALTTILDACALVMVGIGDAPKWQAKLTFKIARHAVVDISQVFRASPQPPKKDRLGPEELVHLRSLLAAAETPLREGAEADHDLGELRHMYEPYVHALSRQLVMALPPWIPGAKVVDNWQTSAWERDALGLDSTVQKCTKGEKGKTAHAGASIGHEHVRPRRLSE